MIKTATPPIVLWMQSLSDQTRGRLLRLVERSELTVVELCAIVQLPQSTVSRHLKVLVDDGWLEQRKDGTSNHYRMIGSQLEGSRRRLWNLVREQALSESITNQDDARLEQVLTDRRSKSQAFFSSTAGQWDRIKSELFGRRVDCWALAALMNGDEVIGDLGCGTGSMAQIVSPWAKQVIGVDSSAAMLQAAKRRLKDRTNVELRRGELTAMPLENDELTSALLVLVLPYVDSPVDVLKDAARATRPGGKLIVVDIVQHSRKEYREELGHTWLGFDTKQIKSWVEDANWRIEKYLELPPDSEAKGPGLFMLTATRA